MDAVHTQMDVHSDGQMTVERSSTFYKLPENQGLTWDYVEPPYGIEP
jgi:hypothetical protein